MSIWRGTSLLIVAGLVAVAAIIATAIALPAQATPDKQKACTSCHSGGAVKGTVTAVPSTTTPVPGAKYTVKITLTMTSTGDTGYWIAKSDALGTTGATTGVYGGGPGSTATTYTATMTAPTVAGTYYYKAWGVRGYSGQANAAGYSIKVPGPDTTAPTTAATGATNNAWYNKALTITLKATDNVGGWGVASITSSLDAALAKTVAAATTTVGIPVNVTTHVNDGAHTLVYNATDKAKNVEVKKTLKVNIDTRKPTTLAPSTASVLLNGTATLKYQVNDTAPNGGKAKVTIAIKNAAGTVVKTLAPGTVTVNAAHTTSFVCTLAKGTYRFYVSATDLAGNAQAAIASNVLTVK